MPVSSNPAFDNLVRTPQRYASSESASGKPVNQNLSDTFAPIKEKPKSSFLKKALKVGAFIAVAAGALALIRKFGLKGDLNDLKAAEGIMNKAKYFTAAAGEKVINCVKAPINWCSKLFKKAPEAVESST